MRSLLVFIVLVIAAAAGLYVAGCSFVLSNNAGDHTVQLQVLADDKPIAQGVLHSHQWNWFIYRTSKTAKLALRCEDQESPGLGSALTADYLSPGKSQGTVIKIEDCALVSTKVLW